MNQQNQDSTKGTSNTRSKLLLIGLPIIIIVAGLLGYIVLSSLAKQPEKKPMLNLAPLVEVSDIHVETVTFEVKSQGSVSPRTQTTLISEVSGMVVAVSDKLHIGGFFKKGEVLLEIDPIIYEVALLEAQSRLESRQAAYIQEQAQAKQAEDEWRMTGKPLTQAPALALRVPQLKRAQAEIKAAEAELKRAKIKLARTKIRSPYDALLTEKYVDIGQYVSVNGQIAKAFAIDYAEVRLPIKQQDVNFLTLPKVNDLGAKGQQVRIYADQGGVPTYWNSHISRYEGVVNQNSRVHYLVAHIDDPYNLYNSEQDAELRIGTFVQARIVGKTMDEVIKLPRTALRGVNTIHTITADNRLNIINVEVIRTDADYVYVKNTIKPKHRLVLTRIVTAVEGMPLRVRGETTPADQDKADDKTQLVNTADEYDDNGK
ncbi:efflux RND transporter periplasmic adaptor subunit [Thalassotalea aquiviva]|uniref:efflux RND transporter periplasmic adaptor subunit n=1 Tax=Thalassotalea aquiviva TaxID=3242415 RepID=UPI00352B8DB6